MAARETLREYRRKRDFEKTGEPEGNRSSDDLAASAGGRRRPARKRLRFVVQKHRASHLHFDFRLELDGVLKSWAVPKGPSLDPAVRRLAMEVEDHPVEYGRFEGTIPEGEYGGGTVMLWDRGYYRPETAQRGRDAQDLLREGYERGDLKFFLNGERLKGGFVLVRMKRPGRPQWLLIKHRDEFARPGSDVTRAETRSVKTGRTMEEVAEGKRRRRKPPTRARARRPTRRRSRQP